MAMQRESRAVAMKSNFAGPALGTAAALALAWLTIRQAALMRLALSPPLEPAAGPSPPIVLGWEGDSSVRRCRVWLPSAAPGTVAELTARLVALYDSEDSPFPFNSPAGYNITIEEGDALDRVVAAAAARMPPSKNKLRFGDNPFCPASTYDGPRVEELGRLFAPGGSGQIREGDAIVDLGAGIGKALVAAAVVSNASLIQGIELSESRYADGCTVLRTLETVFAQRPELAAPGPRRRVELLQGDLFALPGGFFADLPARVTIYSYCNCFPYRLIAQIFQYAAELDRPSVRLLASKEPVSSLMPKQLKRVGFTGTVMANFYERLPPAPSVGGSDELPAAHELRGAARAAGL